MTYTLSQDRYCSVRLKAARVLVLALLWLSCVSGIAAQIGYAADTIQATGGNNQTTQVGAAFPGALVATVIDTTGAAVPNVTVTFDTGISNDARPADTFPTCSFPGGATTATATTNSSGQAMSPLCTANSVYGSYQVGASTPGAANLAIFNLLNAASTYETLAAVSGSGQTAAVNSGFANPLVVSITTNNGESFVPVANASVTFTAPTSGASGTFSGGQASATVLTDSSGLATAPTFTANGIAGTYSVIPSSPGVTSSAVAFSLSNSGTYTLAATSGSGQSALINHAFGSPFVATLTFDGTPVAGATVQFSVSSSSNANGTFAGGVATASVVTNSSGVATAPAFTANSTAGNYVVQAIAIAQGYASTSFQLTNVGIGPPAGILTGTGNGQSAAINTTFGSALSATVVDANGTPVPLAMVTFTAPGSGASGIFAGSGTSVNVVTNTLGVATAPAFTANAAVGNYVVSASVAGAPAPAMFALTNTTGPAASVTATSGGGQTAKINTAFASPFVATVKDASGDLLSGVAVTFSAPASGVSGTFAGGGTSATVNTNSLGFATSPVFTANGVAGSYVVSASVSGLPAATFALTNSNPVAASITATSGSGQSVQVLKPFTAVLTATVTDASGTAVANATVTFTAPASGASATFAGGSLTATAMTNANGVASSPIVTANSIAGNYTVNASVAGVATPANFTLTNLPGAAASIVATSGGGQSMPTSVAFANPLVATVKDASGNAVPNINVIFTAPGTGASATFAGGALSATVSTNSAGVATSPMLTANSTLGSYSVMALISGTTIQTGFALTNVSGVNTITASSGSGQSVQIYGTFNNPLVAIVKDAANNPLANATVTFAAPPSGASGIFAGGLASASVTTNSAGAATSPAFTANNISGTYTVTAALAGLNAPATFSLTNKPGPASSIAATSGGGQSAPIFGLFSNPLTVTVTDAGGNAVPNATVAFSAPGSGASGTFSGSGATASVTTNASGVATSPGFTANGTVGSYSVTASVAGVNAPVTFALTNSNGAASGIVVSSGANQSATVAMAFSNPLAVLVQDAGGNPVANVTVTFSAPGSAATGTFNGAAIATAMTNAQGVATSPTFTASKVAGSYIVTATAQNVSGSALFGLTNIAGPAASVAVSAGTPQNAQINTAFANLLVALVKDTYGNAVANATVIFAAPTSGASGLFSGSGVTATATTNGSGLATAPAFVANSTAGGYTVTGAVSGVAGVAAFNLVNNAGSPASIAMTGGSGQTAQVTVAFASPLSVIVKDAGGNAVANASVIFTAPPSGASGTFAGGAVSSMVQTNSAGIATSPVFTANGTAGSYVVNASVGGVTTQATFALTNSAGSSASIAITLGNGQSAQVKTAFVNPLEVTVKDASGNPVLNATVTFTASSSGASLTFAGGGVTATAQTNSAGLAVSPAIAANGVANSFTVSAAVTGVATPVIFNLTNLAGAPGTIVATSGSGQSAQINAAFTSALVATVTDSNNNPVANATVTFTAPSSGAGGTFPGGAATAMATTNAAGIATSPTFTANGTVGGYAVTASVAGAASPVSFALTNTSGTPASITATSGGGQSARVNNSFSNPFVVTVKDANGNVVSGSNVTFTAPSSGASGTFGTTAIVSSVATNSSGVATSPTFTANGTTGSYSVTASVAGTSATATFALTNLVGLTISTTMLSAGTAGLQYTASLSSTNGTGPYNWTVSKGALPTGLTLNPQTGVISGTPTATGMFAFTVTLTDSSTPSQTATEALTIVITAPVTQPVTPTFTLSGVPSTATPGTNVTNGVIQVSPVSSAAFNGTLTVALAPSVSGLASGYTGDAGFVNSTGTNSTSVSVTIPAGSTSVPLPELDAGTVAGTVTVSLVVGGQTESTATIAVPATAPVIEANSVQITNVTSTGFDVELVATSNTFELTQATFTFTAKTGDTISGGGTITTTNVQSIIQQWFASNPPAQYGGRFSLTIPFTTNGSAGLIQSVSVTLSNTVGTSTAVSGTP